MYKETNADFRNTSAAGQPITVTTAQDMDSSGRNAKLKPEANVEYAQVNNTPAENTYAHRAKQSRKENHKCTCHLSAAIATETTR